MYFKDEFYLCNRKEGFDKFNRPQAEGYTKRLVYGDEKGVKRTEFYQAQTVGYKPELTAEIKKEEYQNERYVEYGGVMYKVIRTFPVENECVSLVCDATAVENGE